MLCSLWDNNIGDQGAIALAAILKETKITDLKCALASNRLPIVFANVSTPIVRPLTPHSPGKYCTHPVHMHFK